MKRIILITAIVVTTGILTIMSRHTDAKEDKIVKISMNLERNLTATAD